MNCITIRIIKKKLESLAGENNRSHQDSDMRVEKRTLSKYFLATISLETTSQSKCYTLAHPEWNGLPIRDYIPQCIVVQIEVIH